MIEKPKLVENAPTIGHYTNRRTLLRRYLSPFFEDDIIDAEFAQAMGQGETCDGATNNYDFEVLVYVHCSTVRAELLELYVLLVDNDNRNLDIIRQSADYPILYYVAFQRHLPLARSARNYADMTDF